MRRPTATLVLAVLALAVVAAPARAQGDGAIAGAAQALRERPVHVDPDAEVRLTANTVAVLRQHLAAAAPPIYVVVLPGRLLARFDDDPGAVLRAVGQRVGDARGVYAAVVGRRFRALAALESGVAQAEVARLAQDALRAEGTDGVAPVLLDFVDRVAAIRPAAGADQASPAAPPADAAADGGGDESPLVPVLVGAAIGLVAGTAGWLVILRRRRAAR